jgi:hypothetical protein
MAGEQPVTTLGRGMNIKLVAFGIKTPGITVVRIVVRYRLFAKAGWQKRKPTRTMV